MSKIRGNSTDSDSDQEFTFEELAQRGGNDEGYESHVS
jgi:hypothetical protein